MTARGIRNNNPGNLRHGSNWDGLAPTQTDPAFCQFTTMAKGCRALLKTLRTYVERHHLNTIRAIVSPMSWATAVPSWRWRRRPRSALWKTS